MSRNKAYAVTLLVAVVVWAALFVLIGRFSGKVVALAALGKSFKQVMASAVESRVDGTNTDQGTGSSGTGDSDPVPRLPSTMAAAVGVPFTVYYDGIVLVRDPDDVIVEISSKTVAGKAERRRWVMIPRTKDVGRHVLTVKVRDWDGRVLDQKKVFLDVVDPVPPDRVLSLLLVGDSITHQSIYPNALYKYLFDWSRGRIRFIGNHHPKADRAMYRSPLPHVYHEGYGGWGWQLFASHYAPGKEDYYKLTKSPFVSVVNNKPVLDVRGYLRRQKIEGKLDLAVFQLGLNETFGANPDDTAALETSVNRTLQWADKLIAAFQEAAPEIRIGLVLPAPFTRSAPTFRKVYRGIRPEFGDPWRHKRIQHHLLVRMLERYDRKDPRIFLIPVNAAMDVVDGYWITDAGHVNELGGKQIAASIYSGILNAIDKGKRPAEWKNGNR